MEYEHTLSDTIIAFLGSARNTKIFYQILRERAFARAKKNSLRTAVYRLEKQGYIKNENGSLSLTNKTYEKSAKRHTIPFIPSPFKKGAPNHSLICFDVPQTKRRARDWLRGQLKMFGFKMVQQSVWIGPGPFPKEFTEHLKELKIDHCIRIFPIAKK